MLKKLSHKLQHCSNPLFPNFYILPNLIDMIINYTGDYKRAGSTLDAAHSTALALEGKDLFNGNIAGWKTNTAGWAGLALNYPQLNQLFTYDELNRITKSELRVGATAIDDYKTTYGYDANGNIIAATANAKAVQMDDLTYNYATYTDPVLNKTRILHNRLLHVDDLASASAATVDVDDQAPGNYTYDAIGNLTGDAQEGTTITWTPYGKVKTVVKSGSPASATTFVYDAAGNRVMKKRDNGAGVVITNYYVRDASGNIMAVYEKQEQSGTTPDTKLIEVPIYGSDRLGLYKGLVSITGTTETLLPGEERISVNTVKNAYESSYLVDNGATLTLGDGFVFEAGVTGAAFSVRVSADLTVPGETNGMFTRALGKRQYELKDHLGNVRTVITDVKKSTLVNGVPKNFEP
jgi:YD repeat-containing protein